MNGLTLLILLTPFAILAIDDLCPGFVDGLIAVFTGKEIR